MSDAYTPVDPQQISEARKAVSSGTTPPETSDSILGKIISGKEREASLTREIGKGTAAIEEQQRQQTSAALQKQREVEQQYAAQTPTFAPSAPSKQELVSLFGMIGAMGAMAGSKGYVSAIGAMNAMGGMLKGYNQGRKDLFEQEKSIFDKQLAENKARYERAANAAKIALEEAKVNLPDAMAKLKMKLRQDEFELLAQRAEGEGLVKVYEKAEQLKNKATELYYRGQQVGISVERLVLEKQKAQGFEKIRGQAGQLEKIIGSDIDKLGSTEVPVVSGRAEAAKATKELSDEIRQNPQAAGVVGKTLSWLDKYIPSRYSGATKDTEYSPSRMEADAASSAEIFSGMSPDEISRARLIQKKVLDIINARTQAVSNRFLVSELNMQKAVLDIGGMSAQSAADVYEGLARDDIKTLRRYIPETAISKINSYVGLTPSAEPSAPAAAAAQKPTAEDRFNQLVKTMSEDQAYDQLKREGYTR